ncbi:MAG: ThuA domain-containing protein [Planctomycetaceae bacterium]|nr:ThuA domain-containing protein [Planctomycetaceae bacterium]
MAIPHLTRRLLLAALCASICLSSARTNAAEAPKPLRVLLVLGGCCHDYAKQQTLLAEGIAQRAHVEVVIAYDPDKSTKHLNPVYEDANWAQGFDAVIHDECSAHVTDESLIDRILEPHRQGLPAVLLHCGMHCYRSEGYPQKVTPWFEFTGLQSTGHGRQAPIDIVYGEDRHEVTQGLDNWTTINEELYNNSAGHLLDTATALASGRQTTKNKQGEENTAEAVVTWVNDYRNGTRVFATTLGHNNDTVADARYLDLVTRGLLWSCGKLNETYLK